MDRMIGILLRASLLLAAIGSVVSLAQMLIATALPVYWSWWAATAFTSGTLLLAGAVHVHNLISLGRIGGSPRSEGEARSAPKLTTVFE